jgi:phage-related protein
MSDALDRAYVEIEPDFSTFNRNVTAGVSAAARSMTRQIGSAINDVENQFARMGNNVADSFNDLDRPIDAAKDELEDLGDEIDRVSGRRVGIDIDIDREGTFSRFLSSITGVRLPVAGFAALGTAASAAAGAVIQLGAALAPAVGIIAGLPAAVGVGAAAIGTLQVATAGFSDAMAAAFEDVESFDAAIENLSPNAQAAAEAFRAAVPELQALQDSAQDAFFINLDEAINAVAATLLGPLSEGMTTAAGYAGDLVTQLLNIAGTEAGVDFVTSSFETLNGVLSQLAAPVAALFTALLDLGTAVNTAFGGEEAVSGLAAMVQQFADFIAAATASGEAVAWIENALAVFRQIGDILSPLVGIFLSIGSAAQDTGGNILGAFGQGLQVFDDFLASAQGQDVLVTLFEALNQVGASLGTVLTNIAPALPPIISGIAGILSVVSPLLGPLSELVGSVLTALAPLLGIIAAAIQPLIGPLTEVIELLGPILIDAITTLMPLIELVANLLGGILSVTIKTVASVLEALTPVITAVLDALEPLIEELQPFFDVLSALAELIGAILEPIITALGTALLWLVENVILPYVIPIIENLAGVLIDTLGVAVQWVVQQFQLAGAGLEIVWNLIRDTIVARVEEMVAGFELLVALFQVGWAVLDSQVFTPIKNGINTVKSVVISALSGIRSNWDSFVGFLKGIPSRISSSLSNLFSPLASGFKSAINSVIDGWNSLSFTVPSVDLGALGEVGGFTVSTPNIPYLQTGGFTQAEGLAMLHPDEMVLPLSNANGINALAAALRLAGISGESGPVEVTVQIGNETITQLVNTEVTRNNKTLTRRARTGTGRN